MGAWSFSVDGFVWNQVSRSPVRDSESNATLLGTGCLERVGRTFFVEVDFHQLCVPGVLLGPTCWEKEGQEEEEKEKENGRQKPTNPSLKGGEIIKNDVGIRTQQTAYDN